MRDQIQKEKNAERERSGERERCKERGEEETLINIVGNVQERGKERDNTERKV